MSTVENIDDFFELISRDRDFGVVSNASELDALIHAMSDFLSRVFVFTTPTLVQRLDFDVSLTKLSRLQLRRARDEYHKKLAVMESNSPRFATTLVTDYPHRTTPAQLKLLASLRSAVDHLEWLGDMSMAMLEEAQPWYREAIDPNETDMEWVRRVNSSEYRSTVDLWFYAFSVAGSPYYRELRFHTARKELVRVPAISTALFDEMRKLATEWLLECDSIFCHVHSIANDGPDEEVEAFCSKAGECIARRHSLLHLPEDEDATAVDRLLGPNFLHRLADYKLNANKEASSRERARDTERLKLLIDLCANDPLTSERGRNVIVRHLDSLYGVVLSPPQELGVRESQSRFESFNFEMLSGVFRPSLSTSSKCACASEWRKAHGEWTASEARLAIQSMWKRRSDDSDEYPHGVFSYFTIASPLPPQDEDADALRLPSNPCAYEEGRWFAHRPDFRKRMDSDDTGTRIVCLCAFLFERILHREFKFGVVSNEVVRIVANKLLHRGKFAQDVIDTERNLHNLGTEYSIFEHDLFNFSSDVNDRFHVPMCSLSHFSAAQINAVFSHPDVFSLVRRTLSERTRALLPKGLITESYTECTDDALTVLLPCINAWRGRQCIQSFSPSNEWLDMMWSIRRVRAWNPHEGTLVLSLDDFSTESDAHPDARRFLDHACAQQPQFVRLASRHAHAKVQYVFDTLLLWRLVSHRQRITQLRRTKRKT